jgi:transposase
VSSAVPGEPTVGQLLAAVAERDALIEALLVRVADLEARLGQNSRNSSRPPSSDGYAKPRSPSRAEQRAAGRRPGKQPGAPGAHLRQVDGPDVVVERAPTGCSGCGASLADAPVVGTERRQVFDLPPVRVHVVEHRLQRRACACGVVTVAPAPAGVRAPAVYGPRLRAVAVYFLHVQHLPLARTARLLAEIFDVAVSEGFLTNLLTAAGAAATPFVDRAREALVAADVAHFDETGVRIDGRLQWLHSASTGRLTLLRTDSRRGREGTDALGVLPAFAGVAVHDGWIAYRQYDQAAHALCNAHHLRDLAAVIERDPTQTWAVELAELLTDANRAAHAARDAGQAALDRPVLHRLHTRYGELIKVAQTAHPPPPPTGKSGSPRLGKTGGLIRRLDTQRDEVLRFATDLRVPFTNNQAERDLRMAKLQMKISGCWRTPGGAETFCALRSYVATVRKNGAHVLTALTTLLAGEPWLPANT